MAVTPAAHKLEAAAHKISKKNTYFIVRQVYHKWKAKQRVPDLHVGECIKQNETGLKQSCSYVGISKLAMTSTYKDEINWKSAKVTGSGVQPGGERRWLRTLEILIWKLDKISTLSYFVENFCMLARWVLHSICF